MFKSGDQIELTIDNIAFGGEAVAHYQSEDGRKYAIFIEGAVPGDVILARIGGKKKNYAFAYIVNFIKKSEQRITPKCPHFVKGLEAHCGGCAMQFFDYNKQIEIKEQHVKDSITRIGGFSENLVKPIIGCQEQWYYRNKMEYSFSRDKQGQIGLGLHLRRRHHDTVELTECYLMEPWNGLYISTIRKYFQSLSFNPDQPLPLISLVLRSGKYTKQNMVNLVTENLTDSTFLETFKEKTEQFFKTANLDLTSLIWTNIINIKGQTKRQEEKNLQGTNAITEKMHRPDSSELSFNISSTAFFQPNTKQAEVLYQEALKAVDPKENEIIFDLYCGAGTIGIFMANKAKHIYGIELNKQAIENAKENAKNNNITNIDFYSGDVSKLINELKEKPATIIVDPPRGGLDPDALKKIANFQAKKIVYVSCNPTTQARDLKVLNTLGYKLIQVQPVDQFPQTYHIESVATLTRE